MANGAKNEREAYKLLRSAGYLAYKPATVTYGENDPWGMFDILAFHVEKPPLFVQVKSNGARGVRAWMRQTWLWRSHGIRTQYWVRYDSQGWRVLEPTSDGHTTVVDERENAHAIGRGVRQYLDSL